MRGATFGIYASAQHPASSGPTTLLNPTGCPYNGLGNPLLSGLPNLHITSSEQLSGYSLTNPLQANKLTIDSGVDITSANFSLWIWCDTLVLNGTLDVSGNNGGNGTGCACCACGGQGAAGASGGGGGGASYNGHQADGGDGGSGGNGVVGSNMGQGTSPGQGGAGYGTSYNGSFAWLSGGFGGSAYEQRCCGYGGAGIPGAGYGGGGAGGSSSANCCDTAEGGGGAGAGGLVCIVTRIAIGSTGGVIYTNGGQGGSGSSISGAGGGAGGGGGGVIHFYAQEFDNTLSFSCLGGSGGAGNGSLPAGTSGGNGNYFLQQINHVGTGLGTSYTNTTASWNNS